MEREPRQFCQVIEASCIKFEEYTDTFLDNEPIQELETCRGTCVNVRRSKLFFQIKNKCV